ncbi:ATP-binding cassette sub-family G member 1-like [Cylas formicarius]|uniref:ATP-binding cassette sub-family G member 1-like n=1 Tax=Cylas formicarius TaxID=197179 RepID=UPI0029589990|nr:ATP-binding cassette sub-family G member 1-like [Cylas formicarius]
MALSLDLSSGRTRDRSRFQASEMNGSVGTAPRLKKLARIRPDSQKIDLLTIPENGYVDKFETSIVGGAAVTVTFRDVSYTVREGIFKRQWKRVLDNVNGEFQGGHLTAIMGPSGSGKSTLMNILAGYTTGISSGQLYTNQQIRNELAFRKQSCYIMQDDKLQPLLTVQEAMTVAANLKLPSSVSAQEKHNKVKEILESISLWPHRKVKTKSLSGGQKKRLSIALELIKNPQIMFFDEPTSGLDSLTSKQCVMLLKQLAQAGKTIVCTIHQPSAMIFDLFDHLYTLSDGRCMYQGSVKGLLSYLEELDLKCPPYHNPADYLLEVVSGEHGDHSEELVKKSKNGLNQDWISVEAGSLQLDTIEHIDKMMKSGTITPVHAPAIVFPRPNFCDIKSDESDACCKGTYPTTCLYQVLVLLKRAFLVLSRDRTLTYNRLATHSLIALFIGILYYGVGRDASNMMNNFNFLFFTVMFLMLTALNCITTTFPTEVPIISREHFNKWYSLKSYYIAISVADIPVQMLATIIYGLVTYFLTQQPVELYRLLSFLLMCILISLVAQSFGLFIGACMEIKNGVIFGPFCFLPFTIFSGFFVQLNDCHPYLQWVFHISFLKYGLEGLVLSVFGYGRPKLPCNADYCHFVYPTKFLNEMDMENALYSNAVIFLLGLTVFLRVIGYYALRIQIQRSRSKRV